MKYRNEYDTKQIGRNLRRCREAKGLSVEAVRQYLRIGSPQAVYRWEEGKCYPQTDTMLALMELYEAELKDIIYGKEEAFSSFPASLSFWYSCMEIERIPRREKSRNKRIKEYYERYVKECGAAG